MIAALFSVGAAFAADAPGSQFHYDRCLGPSECVLLLTFPAGGFDYVPGK